MRKILLVSNYYSSYISAGTSKRTMEIKSGLSKLGWKCKVITVKRKNLTISKEPDKDEIIALESLSERYPIPFFHKINLYKIIKSSDIVHIISHWSLLNILCIFYCLLSKTPYIYSPCGALKPIGNNILIKKLYNLFFLRIIFNYASCIFAVTNKELREINDLSNKKVKTIVFPNGIWKESSIRGIENIDKKFSNFYLPLKFILFVGRLSTVKGPDILLKAFLSSKIKDEYSLIFVGPDENMKNRMIKYINDFSKNKNIFFLGSASHEKRDFLMKKATLTVIPSRREAMSMVALESSLIGTPFLATKSCGLDDFAANSSGFICNGDIKSISKNLDKILKNQNLIKETGDNAKNYVLSFYTWDSIIEKMSFCLDKLISQK